jgi:hypothetical protein
LLTRTIRLARWRRLTVATLLPAALVLGACSGQASHGSGPDPVVKLSYCGGSLQVRPSVIGVICTVTEITARDLNWSSWGKPIASAIGTAVIDLCAYSDCHTGHYKTVPIVVVASKIKTCANHMHAYSTLQYVFVGPSPYRGVPAHMKFPKFWFGSARPSPGNQTVGLTC